MSAATLHPRFAEAPLVEALADTPVVLIHDPRQSGKTTLAQKVAASRGYAYLSFDDDVALSAVRADPLGFVVDLPERAELDEVQRVPELFTALKTAVDRGGPRPDPWTLHPVRLRLRSPAGPGASIRRPCPPGPRPRAEDSGALRGARCACEVKGAALA